MTGLLSRSAPLARTRTRGRPQAHSHSRSHSLQTWWQRDRDLTLIVAGRTDACAASAKTNRKDTHG